MNKDQVLEIMKSKMIDILPDLTAEQIHRKQA